MGQALLLGPKQVTRAEWRPRLCRPPQYWLLIGQHRFGRFDLHLKNSNLESEILIIKLVLNIQIILAQLRPVVNQVNTGLEETPAHSLLTTHIPSRLHLREHKMRGNSDLPQVNYKYT